MSLVRQRCPQATLVLLGNGAAEEALLKLANDLQLGDNFLHLPAVPYQEAPRYVNLCDIGIMAYPDSEYWTYNNPIKLLEYLALGKPVIVRDMVTFRSVVDGHPGAIFIARNDPITIADAICDAQMDSERLQMRGIQGRDIIVQNYTWAQQATRVDSFLRKAA
jgi:glycosyltransferase involved in cell wall biosynthesis